MKKNCLILILLFTTTCVFAQNNKEQLFGNFMNTYKTLNQALQSSIVQHGLVGSWYWKNDEDSVFDEYFKPYLKIKKTCEINETECWNASSYKALDERTPETPEGLHKSYLLENGSSLVFVLKDKNCIENGHTCAFLWIDTNGFEDPNTAGRDFYKFYVHPNSNKVNPVGYSYKGSPDIKSINKSCSENSTGNYCGAKLLIENAMNY